MENNSTFEDWLVNLRTLAVGLKLNSESPWRNRDMAAALTEDDLWLDYYAAGSTPQEAFDDANAFDEADTFDPFEAELAEYEFNKKNKEK